LTSCLMISATKQSPRSQVRNKHDAARPSAELWHTSWCSHIRFKRSYEYTDAPVTHTHTCTHAHTHTHTHTHMHTHTHTLPHTRARTHTHIAFPMVVTTRLYVALKHPPGYAQAGGHFHYVSPKSRVGEIWQLRDLAMAWNSTHVGHYYSEFDCKTSLCQVSGRVHLSHALLRSTHIPPCTSILLMYRLLTDH
jgi:hypothetical protein